MHFLRDPLVAVAGPRKVQYLESHLVVTLALTKNCPSFIAFPTLLIDRTRLTFISPVRHHFCARHHALHSSELEFLSAWIFVDAMRPLILHNVPDDELYTGEDGIQRPYAMIFPEYASPMTQSRWFIADVTRSVTYDSLTGATANEMRRDAEQ